MFHAFQRPYVPVKHKAKKVYFVAMQDTFFVWNKEKMEELVCKMKAARLSDDDIWSMTYYNSRLFTTCVDREVPRHLLLYWRMRAVHILYGSIIDRKSGKPFFTKKSWTKANRVLNKILLGYYSDPPGMSMYTNKLNEDGSVKKKNMEWKLLNVTEVQTARRISTKTLLQPLDVGTLELKCLIVCL